MADPNWIDNGDGTANLATPIAALAAGTSTTVDIIFTVDAGASGTIDNFAEISGAMDDMGNVVPDVDSTPDAIDDDVFLTDDDVTDNGLAGGDEDDHDRAQLNVEPPPEAEAEAEAPAVEAPTAVEEVPVLAFTGTSSDVLAIIASAVLILGLLMAAATRRSDYETQ